MDEHIVEPIIEKEERWSPINDGDFFKKYLSNVEFEIEDKETVIQNSSEILSRCINPNHSKSNKKVFMSTGLMMGMIQSGKTASMQAVSAMAKDNGFKLIIVMSGHVGSLTEQTSERFYDSLSGYGWKRFDIPGDNSMNFMQFAQDIKNAFDTWDNKFNDRSEMQTVLIVTMKNPHRLYKLQTLLNNVAQQGVNFENIPCLVVDDEADHHSLNTRWRQAVRGNNLINFPTGGRRPLGASFHVVQENETLDEIADLYGLEENVLIRLNNLNSSDDTQPGDQLLIERVEGATHRQIKDIRQILTNHSYLGYTATPYGNLLAETINHLSPNFAQILEPGQQYTGGDYFFRDEVSRDRYIYEIPTNEITNLNQHNEKPNSLVEALRFFIIGLASGFLQKDHLNGKSRSMIIHPSHLTGEHEKFLGFVNDEINRWRRLFNSIDKKFKEPGTDEEIDGFKNSYEVFKENNPNLNLRSFDEQFINSLIKSLQDIRVIEFNAREGSIPQIKWDKEGIYGRILVGGIGIERGYTIKGLTVTYMIRGIGGRQVDTIQQRARFYGYHHEYSDFVRIYLTTDLIDIFQTSYEVERHMRNSVENHLDNNGNMKEWARRWRGGNIDQYNLTARSKIAFTLHSIGREPLIAKQRKAYDLSKTELENNRRILEEINTFDKQKISDMCHDSRRAWLEDGKYQDEIITNVNLSTVKDYLLKINHHNIDSQHFQIVEDVITSYLEASPDVPCPIVLMSDPRRVRRSTRGHLRVVQTHQGRRPNDVTGYPGDRFFHHDYLIGLNDDDKPIESPTLQVYSLNIDVKNPEDKSIEIKIKNTPFFNFYIPKSMIPSASVEGTEN